MTKNTENTNLKLSEENKEKILSDIEQGSVVLIKINNVEGGHASVNVGTFLTGTSESRHENLSEKALSIFTNAIGSMVSRELDEMIGKAVQRSIQADPKLARIFEPKLPEEMLNIFDSAESFDDAIAQMSESGIDAECDCPNCTEERKQEAEDIEKGNIPVH
ncbi:MAG: hypothetical protein ACPHQD_17770 [Vibrio toranzoniae]|uniref:hypothetical protein n=1 Tax=Vibrio toranzoniae TaxID=1194427 RepID=UPI003C5F781B